jgi:hypothetical protein
VAFIVVTPPAVVAVVAVPALEQADSSQDGTATATPAMAAFRKKLRRFNDGMFSWSVI